MLTTLWQFPVNRHPGARGARRPPQRSSTRHSQWRPDGARCFGQVAPRGRRRRSQDHPPARPPSHRPHYRQHKRQHPLRRRNTSALAWATRDSGQASARPDRRANPLNHLRRILHFDDQTLVVLVIEIDHDGALGIVDVEKDEAVALVERTRRQHSREAAARATIRAPAPDRRARRECARGESRAGS
jgi:hypothetical protein